MKKFVFCNVIFALFLFLNSVETQAGSNKSRASADAGNNMAYERQFFSIQKNSSAIKQRIKDSVLLNNINKIILEGGTATVSASGISLNNIRIESDTTNLDDYISINFLMDLESLQLIPQEIEIVNNLGIYYEDEDLFSKDIAEDIYMTTPTGTTLSSDTLYNVTATKEDEFQIFLEAGTVLTMRLKDPTDDYELQIDKPDGSQKIRSLYQKGSNWYSYGISILESGIYTFRFVPQNNSYVTLEFGFTNNNRKTLEEISSGSNISTSLNGWGHEYAKYHISLNAGDLLEVSDTSDDDIWFYLVNSNNQVVEHGNGGIYERVSSTADYYLFIMNRDYSNGSSYSCSVQVTPDSNIVDYPVLSDIDDQTVNQNQNFSLQLSASNNPTKFNVYGLPEGITIDENSGLISGTTTTIGVFSVRAYVENEFGSDQQDFVLTVLSNDEFTGELAEDIQSYLVLTENSVPFYLSPGSYVQAFGSDAMNTINVEEYARLQCQNFIGENEINIEEASSEFTVYRSGATVYLNSTSGTRVEIAATETSQILRFADGSLELAIITGNVMLGSQLVDETEQLIDSPADESDTSESTF